MIELKTCNIILGGRRSKVKDIVTSILTDESARDAATVEQILTEQAVASPWSSESLS